MLAREKHSAKIDEVAEEKQTDDFCTELNENIQKRQKVEEEEVADPLAIAPKQPPVEAPEQPKQEKPK
jgi:hypothetical protein